MKKIILLMIIILASIAFAGEFHYGGFWKNYAKTNFIPEYFQEMAGYGQANGVLDQTFRIDLSYSPSNFVSFNTSYNIAARIHDPSFDISALSIGGNGIEPYRFDDFDNPIYPSPDHPEQTNLNILGNLDRAYIRLSWKGDLYLGRQAIAWGTARMVNPTDVIMPYSYDALDTEERPGVDAARLRIPISIMSEIDMGFIAGEDFDIDRSAVFGRGKFYALDTDFSVIAAKYKKNMMFGFDMMRSIGGAGVWLEAAYSNLEVDSAQIGATEQDLFRLSAGADYSFGDKLYGWAEYHYNNAGKTFGEEYNVILNDPAYRSGEVYLLGQHYIIPGANYSINPLLTGSGVVYFNIVDQSALIVPTLEYNIAENVYIAFGGYIGIGESMKNDAGIIPKINSEFGAYPDMLYGAFRVYF